MIDGGDFSGRIACGAAGRSQPDCALLIAAGKPDRPVALTLSHPLAAFISIISAFSIDARVCPASGVPVDGLQSVYCIAIECDGAKNVEAEDDAALQYKIGGAVQRK
jgi:hypothetical protein